MTIVRVQKIIWNQNTSKHIAKHHVTIDDAKKIINSDALIIEGHSRKKIIINRLGVRILSVIVKMDGNKLIISTARDADKKERIHFYEFENNKKTRS